MDDANSERIDEMVTDISVWIGRTAVGSMEKIYERDALIELQRLGKFAKDAITENSRLRSELAAIRDAGDEEIDDVASKSLHSPNSFERHCFAERLAYIAKARGARIRELEKEHDEVIGLLRWLTQFGQVASYLEMYPRNDQAKRIKELTAKREGE